MLKILIGPSLSSSGHQFTSLAVRYPADLWIGSLFNVNFGTYCTQTRTLALLIAKSIKRGWFVSIHYYLLFPDGSPLDHRVQRLNGRIISWTQP